MNYLMVIIAILLTFIASFAWYMLFGKQLAMLNSKAYGNSSRPGPQKMLLELLRNAILALVVSYLTSQLHVTYLSQSILLAVVLWIGFPVVLLSGSVLHEKVPVKLAAIHSGDWLIKLLILVALLRAN
jgi:hypothetical protein